MSSLFRGKCFLHVMIVNFRGLSDFDVLRNQVWKIPEWISKCYYENHEGNKNRKTISDSGDDVNC